MRSRGPTATDRGTHGDNYRKYNGVLRYSLGDVRNGFAITGMGYSGKWDSTDQVAQRAVDDGVISRFGSLDPTDGGETHRYSLSAEWQRSSATSVTRAVAYGIDYKLNLFSNFTYFLDHPDTGDQFEQADDRNVYGTKVTHRWFARWFGVDAENEIGFQGRFDDIHIDRAVPHGERARGSRHDPGGQGAAGERRSLRPERHSLERASFGRFWAFAATSTIST